MNEYLARLKAKIQEKPIPKELTKPTKPTFVSFVSYRGRHISEIERPPDPARVALEEHNGRASNSALELAEGAEDRQHAGANTATPGTAKTVKTPPAPAPWPEPKITGTPPFGADHVPSRYEAAWQALLAGCPPRATPLFWQAAIFDAAILFGDFGKLIDEYHWTPGDLFDAPGGLIWFIHGSPVVAIGHSMAQCQDGRIWRRVDVLDGREPAFDDAMPF
jgi:hypothetical protein